MKYTVDSYKHTVTIISSFTYTEYTELRMKYLGYDINVPNQVCKFELN